MEGWKYWEGKKVFINLRNNRQYSGKVIEVTTENNGLCFISILDKYSKRVTFANSEISEIKEEG